MGKGSARRPGNEEAYRRNYERIFRMPKSLCCDAEVSVSDLSRLYICNKCKSTCYIKPNEEKTSIICPTCGMEGWDYETGYCRVCNEKK